MDSSQVRQMLELMSRVLFCLIVSVSLLFFGADAGTRLAAQETSKPTYFRSGPGVVLLQNGEVFQGDVQAFDRELEVKLDQTGSVRFPNEKVSYVAETLDELYIYQANRIQSWGIGDHLKLGRWCAQQRLFERAMPHYEYLKQEIPNRQEFKQFQTELRDAMLRDQRFQAALAAAGYVSSASTTNPTMPVNGTGIDNSVSSASSISNSTSNSVTTAGHNGNRLAKSQQAIRVAVQDQEVFRLDIHPVLVASCARAACHGAFSSNAFSLMDATRMSTRDAMGQNLSAFTSYVNDRRGTAESLPEDHPLYQKAVNRHGQLFESPLNVEDPKHQRFMEQLRLWIARTNSQQQVSSNDLATGMLGADPNRLATPSSPLANSGLVPRFDHPPSLAPRAAEYLKAQSLESQAKNSTPLLKGQEMDGIAAAIARLEGLEKQRQASKDPFDPAEFNALYAKPADPKQTNNASPSGN